MILSLSDKNELVSTSLFGFLHHFRQTLLFRVAVVGIVVIAAAAIILSAGWAISGNRMGIWAGSAAGGVCLLAAWIALIVGESLRRPQYALAGVLLAMLIRMGIPLAAALLVFLRGGPLADAGFLYYLVLFYPVTLTAETFLLLPKRCSHEKRVSPAQDLVG